MEQLTDNNNPTQHTPRNSFVAFFLSLLVPGLGHVYIGQLKQGIVFFLSLFLILVIAFAIGVPNAYWLLSLLIISVLLRLFIMISATIKAAGKKEYILKPYNKWYIYLLVIVIYFSVLLVYDVRSLFGLESYRAASSANEPGLHVGDYLIADKEAFDSKPIKSGDLVVFESPTGQGKWIHRVVAVPGDKLDIINNFVCIDGVCSDTQYIGSFNDDYDGREIQEYVERLPNGYQHRIYKYKEEYINDTIRLKNIVVPPDHYYLLGDNRDNALDSRYIGLIHKDAIEAKVLYSYWGESAERFNVDFR